MIPRSERGWESCGTHRGTFQRLQRAESGDGRLRSCRTDPGAECGGRVGSVCAQAECCASPSLHLGGDIGHRKPLHKVGPTVRNPLLPRALPPGTNVCAVANGGCQQLCLYRGGGQRACACAHGMLAEDGAACREYAGYLLYSERTILKSIHLSDERNLNAPVQPFEDPEHMKNVIALAFDYRAGTSLGTPNRIFFSDIHFGNIQQINDDGSGRTTIVESEPRPRSSREGEGRGLWGELAPPAGRKALSQPTGPPI